MSCVGPKSVRRAKSGWGLLKGKQLYIQKLYETEKEANSALVDLLLPYPVDSLWRKQLRVAFVGKELPHEDLPNTPLRQEVFRGVGAPCCPVPVPLCGEDLGQGVGGSLPEAGQEA